VESLTQYAWHPDDAFLIPWAGHLARAVVCAVASA
jgi:hypothetical protein